MDEFELRVGSLSFAAVERPVPYDTVLEEYVRRVQAFDTAT